MMMRAVMSRIFPWTNGALIAGAVCVLGAGMSARSGAPAACEAVTKLVRISELPEGSGLAASLRTPGRFWSHNDSGDAVLVALDGSGKVTGRVQVTGASVEDWEAVAVGTCPGGSCLYIGDIGDNDAKRSRITVYRMSEPAEASGSVPVTDVFHATYPDGAHDAESLLISADGRLHIVTKGDTGPVSLYRFPADLRTGSTMKLERVGSPRSTGQPGEGDRITDGSVSRDGQWIVLRTKQSLTFYRSNEFLSGNWRPAAQHTVASLGEPQGEGVAFGAETAVYLMSEGGGKKRPGTFARLSCTLNR